MLFVLYGTERLLMDQRLQKLKKEYQCSQELMNYNSYDVSKEGMKVVLEDVMTPSFLSEQKMSVINHCDFLTTKKLKKENINLFILTNKCINKEVFAFYNI